MDLLKIVGGGVPRVEKHRFRLDSLVGNGADEHFLKMIVLRFAVARVIVNSEVDRVVAALFAVCMDQVDYVDPAHEAVFGSAVLELDELDMLGVLLVLDAVVQDQVSVFTVVDKRSDEIPELSGCWLIAA